MKAFEKVIGYKAIKKELIMISDVLANGEAYGKLGVRAPRGILLYGDPGVGKTLMSNAIIEASGRKAFVCRKDKPNGDFVKAIKKTFSEAKEAAPSIVFLDDMDKFANADDRHPDAEEYVTVQSCIDGVGNKDVFVLATANNIRCLPRSLLRAGRFDRVIEICNPHGEDAGKIVDHYIKQKKFVGDIDPVTAARIMDGHSCAALETVINEAGLYAGFERSDEITFDHFLKACLHTIHNVPLEVLNEAKFNIDLSDPGNIMARVVYHEAGHATVAEVLDPGSVTLVSAYSRDGGSEGFVSYCRGDSDGSVETVKANICSSLGGMAALEQRFGLADSGTSRDLNYAFDLTRQLVSENCVCGFGLHSYFEDSQELQAKQEKTAAAEIERYYRKTKEILAVNRELFEAIASALSEKGVLTEADIKRIKNNCKIVPLAV
ncbi:MAG: AAA family ATPase [Clostridia bacterium]|nr:AAA family ATPase [Clostridia bacterium]